MPAFSGLITSNTIWEGTIQLTGTVKVSEGAVLTIKPGTKIVVDPGEDIRIWATNGGQINAVGTPEENIVFTSSGDQQNDWLGIELSDDTDSVGDADGHLTGSHLSNVLVENATTGISIANQGVSIANSTFKNNNSGVRLKSTSNVYIGDSEFIGSGEGIATDYEGGGKHRDVFLMRNTFNEGSRGISIIPNQRDIHNIVVTGNEFLGEAAGATFGGGGYGSYIGEITIRGNTFAHDSRGISIRAYSWNPRDTELAKPIEKNIDIEGNLFFNSNGISIGYSDGNGNIDISGNYFKDLIGVGTAITSSYARNDYAISNNLFENLNVGIDLKTSSSEIQNNTFNGIGKFAIKNLTSTTNISENNILMHKGDYIYQTRDTTDPETPINVGVSFYDIETEKKSFSDDGSGNFFYPVIINGGNSGIPFSTVTSSLLSSPSDFNRAPTDLFLSSSIFDENIVGGSVVANLSSTDPDIGETHAYKLINNKKNPDNKAFALVGNQLKIVNTPDFETKDVFNIKLQTKDSGGLIFKKAFTLFVNDLEDVVTPTPTPTPTPETTPTPSPTPETTPTPSPTPETTPTPSPTPEIFPTPTPTPIPTPQTSPIPAPGDQVEVEEPIPLIDIEQQDAVTNLVLDQAITFGDSEVENVIVGTTSNDKITGTSNGEIIAGGNGRNKLKGGGGADGFLFQNADLFGKKQIDVLVDFDSSEGDGILIDKSEFGIKNKVKFQSVKGKKSLNNASNSGKQFIYDEKTGLLYFNENGKEDGWGDGGVFVKFKGATELGASDFTIV